MHPAYYRYLNAHGKGTTSTVFLFVVAEFVKVVLASTAPMESSEELGDNSAETPKVAGYSIVLSWTKQELRRSIRPIIIVSTSIASGGHIFH